jgi:threonine/homoserine/homoserine lactone efflux protein
MGQSGVRAALPLIAGVEVGLHLWVVASGFGLAISKL